MNKTFAMTLGGALLATVSFYALATNETPSMPHAKMPMQHAGQMNGQAMPHDQTQMQAHMGMMNPEMMKQKQAMMSAHMAKMETHMANIEALLQKLVALQEKK